jgi:type IV secretory pathway VirB9-like protein
VNYRVEGDTYVVDRVLDRAALLSGVGGSQQEVEITHQGRIN